MIETNGFSNPENWINPIIQEDGDVRGMQGCSIVIINEITPYLDAQPFAHLATVCKMMWENQKETVSNKRAQGRSIYAVFSKLPSVLITKTISFSYFPSLQKKWLVERERWQHLNTGFVTEEQRSQLDTAHQLTEQLYGLLEYSLISKSVYKDLTEQRRILSTRIVEIVTEIQDGHRGTKCLRECVDSGAYLKVFRVFFFYKPHALFNYATDEKRNEGYKKTILHNAVSPNQWRISVPFVAFILEMDRKHQLGVTRHKDCELRTPLETTLGGFMPSTKLEIAARKVTQRLLIEENQKWLMVKKVVNNIIDASWRKITASHPSPVPIKQNISLSLARPVLVGQTPGVDLVPVSTSSASELPPQPLPNNNYISSLFLGLWNAISSFIVWVFRCFSFN